VIAFDADDSSDEQKEGWNSFFKSTGASEVITKVLPV